MRWGIAAVLVVVSVGTARAQTEPGWDDYHRAFVLVAEGKADEARVLLRKVVLTQPGQPVAHLARVRLGELDANRSVDRPEPDRERSSKLARAELGLYSTLNGIAAGVMVCEIAECDGSRAEALSMIGGGGLGLGASLFATRDGITQGRAQLTNSSMVWGLTNGLLIARIADTDDRELATLALGGQAIGLAGSFGLWETWRPSSGDVALTNTTGLWTTALVLLAHGVADTEPELATILVTIDAGLLAGGLLSTKYEVSRGRTLLIDVGGMVGALAGGLVAVAADPDSTSAAFTPILLGTTGGLLLAIYATRDWDLDADDLPPVNAGIGPMGDGGWGARVSLGLDL